MIAETAPTCGHCPAIVAETDRWHRIRCWGRVRFRCPLSGRYVAPDDACTASLHDLRRMERFCTAARAERGEIDRHALYTVEADGLGRTRRIYIANDDRDQGGGVQWRIAQDEQTEG